MNITRKQRNIFWLIILMLVGIYYAPSVIMSFRRVAFIRQQAAQQQAAQQQAAQQAAREAAIAKAQEQAANIAGHAPSSPIDTADATHAALAGTWQGRALLPNRGTCTLQIDLQDAKNQFTGRSSLACAPLLPTQPRMNPSFAIVSGTEDKGSINLAVDKFIGATPGIQSCVITGFSLTPFGPGEMIAQWSDGSCQGGQISLKKAKS